MFQVWIDGDSEGLYSELALAWYAASTAILNGASKAEIINLADCTIVCTTDDCR